MGGGAIEIHGGGIYIQGGSFPPPIYLTIDSPFPRRGYSTFPPPPRVALTPGKLSNTSQNSLIKPTLFYSNSLIISKNNDYVRKCLRNFLSIIGTCSDLTGIIVLYYIV